MTATGRNEITSISCYPDVNQKFIQRENELLCGMRIRSVHDLVFYYKQSNRTPRCSRKVSAAGLTWIEHFRYT